MFKLFSFYHKYNQLNNLDQNKKTKNIEMTFKKQETTTTTSRRQFGANRLRIDEYFSELKNKIDLLVEVYLAENCHDHQHSHVSRVTDGHRAQQGPRAVGEGGG
jgi:uncharacterized protein YfaS (alpha-2-macroglobulin family)